MGLEQHYSNTLPRFKNTKITNGILMLNNSDYRRNCHLCDMVPVNVL
jgi:hypothetical protein